MDVKQSYKEQLRLYRQMFNIGIEQEKAIKAKDYKRLLSLVRKREEIIDRINTIKKSSSFSSQHSDAGIRGVIGEIIHLLKEILNQEKKNESLLRNNMQQVSYNMRQIDKAKLLQRTYRGLSLPRSCFLDQRK